MSFELLSRVMQDQRTSGATRLVLFVLADMANELGECWPGYDGIARRANINRCTAIKAVSWLEQNGYLFIQRRPVRDKFNKTNLYQVQVPEAGSGESQPGVVVAGHQGGRESQPGVVVPGNQGSGVAQPGVVVPGNQGSGVAQPESPINPQLNLPPPLPRATGGFNIISLYEQNFGPITPFIAEDLVEAEKTYAPEWIVAAMRECVRNNTRRWKYCQAILQRYQRDGFGVDSPRRPVPVRKTPAESFTDRMLRWADEQEAARSARAAPRLTPPQANEG